MSNCFKFYYLLSRISRWGAACLEEFGIMSDLRILLQRIEHFRDKLEQMEAGSISSEGADEGWSHGGWSRATGGSSLGWQQLLQDKSHDEEGAKCDDALTHSPKDECERLSNAASTAEMVFWREQCQILRQRWEACEADTITLRWRHRGNPRLEHHQHTGALLTQWEQWLTRGVISHSMCEQLQHCLQDRLRRFEIALNRSRKHEDRLSRLSRCYHLCLKEARLMVAEVADLAEELLAEAHQGQPIQWEPIQNTGRGRTEILHETQGTDQSLITICYHVASYALHMAQVAARMILYDAEWRVHPLPVLTAALVADIGWLRLPESVIDKPAQQWSEQEWQAVESHPLRGAELLAQTAPELAPLVPIVAAHHERCDGSGYPHGRQGEAIPALARLLAVADVYTTRRAPMNGDTFQDSRQALTDVLLEAEQGRLDERAVALLAQLSFYPTGTLVELSDGSAAVVLAPPPWPADPRTAHRPLVARLTTADGIALTCPELLPLSGSDQGVVVRPLPPTRVLPLLRLFPDL
jgi:HD-GYP domain-containing protein (c-di-GMP phosphodiesterase class II)